MPDDKTYTLEELEALKEAFPDLAGRIDMAIASMGEATDQGLRLAQVSQYLGLSQNAVSDAFAKVAEKADFAKTALSNLANNLGLAGVVEDALSGQTQNLATTVLQGATAFEPFLNVLQKSREGFGELGQAGERLQAQLGDSIGRITPVMAKLGFPEFALAGWQRWGQSVDIARNAERGIVEMAAATGRMSEVVGEGGVNVDMLNDQLAKYAEQNYQIANATGVSVKAASTFASAVGRLIPGALDETMDSVEGVTKGMSAQLAAMRMVTSGLISQKDMVALLDEAYLNLNRSMAEGVDLFSQIADQADRLDMRMDLLRKFTMETAGAFRFYGDNAQGAISIMEAFGKKMSDNLGQKTVIDIIGGITTGIQKMDIAQKAFISGVTGGPGGLAGAFGIEAQLMRGDLAGVGQTVMEAMQTQFAGPALTPEDVERNQSLAGELEKQIQLLGQVAGISDRTQAMQILGAMQKGAVEELGRVIAEGRKEPMEKQLEASNKLAQRQTSSLDLISNYTERLVMQGAITNYALLRNAGGQGARDMMEAAAGLAGRVTVQGTTEERFTRRTATEASEGFTRMREDVNNMRTRIMGELRSMGGRTTTAAPVAPAAGGAAAAAAAPAARAPRVPGPVNELARSRAAVERAFPGALGPAAGAELLPPVIARRAAGTELRPTLVPPGTRPPTAAGELGVAEAGEEETPAARRRRRAAEREGPGMAMGRTEPQELVLTGTVEMVDRDGKLAGMLRGTAQSVNQQEQARKATDQLGY